MTSRRELKKVRWGGGNYVPTLWYYPDLEFLREETFTEELGDPLETAKETRDEDKLSTEQWIVNPVSNPQVKPFIQISL